MHGNNGYSGKQIPKAPTYEFHKTGEVFDSLLTDLANPKPPEMPTGITKLDGVIGGLHRGHLTIIAGRPGGGKTSLASQIGWRIARDYQKKVFMFSLEMSKKEIITRLMCNELQIEHDLIYKGKELGGLNEKIQRSRHIFDATPFVVFDDVGYRFHDVDFVTNDFPKNKPDVVIVDHIQLVDKRGFSNSIDAIEQYARKCKEFARITNTAWVILSQINRQGETRVGSPRIENLKGAGALEEIADTVIIGSWDGYKGSEYKVDVAKHRHGRRGVMLVEFQPQYFRFNNIQTEITASNAKPPRPKSFYEKEEKEYEVNQMELI